MVGHSAHSTRKPGSYEHEKNDDHAPGQDSHPPHPNAHHGSRNSNPPMQSEGDGM
jgi:hypothetical protein